jgi:hypothetical protein
MPASSCGQRGDRSPANAFAFAAQTINIWMTAAAITLGIAIPALVYALMRVGAALYIDCHTKA